MKRLIVLLLCAAVWIGSLQGSFAVSGKKGAGGGGGNQQGPQQKPGPVVGPTVTRTVCTGEGYYFTLNIRGPGGANTLTHVGAASSDPTIASASYDIPSQTVSGTGLSPGIATITVTGAVQAASGNIPFSQSIIVNVITCLSADVCKGATAFVSIDNAANAASSNTNVATASTLAKGVNITGVNPGAAVVSVTDAGGKQVGKITVGVKKCPLPPVVYVVPPPHAPPLPPPPPPPVALPTPGSQPVSPGTQPSPSPPPPERDDKIEEGEGPVPPPVKSMELCEGETRETRLSDERASFMEALSDNYAVAAGIVTPLGSAPASHYPTETPAFSSFKIEVTGVSPGFAIITVEAISPSRLGGGAITQVAEYLYVTVKACIPEQSVPVTSRPLPPPLPSPPVETHITGVDVNRVAVEVLNHTDKPVTVEIGPGTVLIPDNPRYQEMMTVHDARLSVDPNSEAKTEVRANCIQMGKEEPDMLVRFAPVLPFDDIVQNLAAMTSRAGISTAIDQVRVWIYTDHADYASINKRLTTAVPKSDYLQAAYDLAAKGGVDFSSPSYAKLLDPQLLFDSSDSPESVKWLVDKLSVSNPQGLSDAIAKETPVLSSSLQENHSVQEVSHASDLASSLCQNENHQTRLAGLSFLLNGIPETVRQDKRLDEALQSATLLLQSDDPGEVEQAILVMQAYSYTPSIDTLKALKVYGHDDKTKNLADAALKAMVTK